jgi:hypothetical protein
MDGAAFAALTEIKFGKSRVEERNRSAKFDREQCLAPVGRSNSPS